MANEQEEDLQFSMEVRLKEDEDGSFRSEVAAGIDEQLAAVEAALRKGAPPGEYQDLNTLKAGLQAASTVLDRTWNFYHR